MVSLEVESNQAAKFFGRFGRFGGTEEQFQMLLSDDNLMEAWMRSLSASATALVAHVSYQLIPFVELNSTVFDGASEMFFIDECIWEEHESVRGKVDRTPGEKNFLVRHFDKKMQNKEVVAWAEAYGYRVATHEEAIDFAKAHPELQRQFWIVALGSFILRYGSSRHFAILNGSVTGRHLGGGGSNAWDPDCRFLLVRK